jgi:hypothetical protein
MRRKDRKSGTKPFCMAWFVYLLRCADGSLYTGIAKDVNRRCQQHNAGTASRLPAAACQSNWFTKRPMPAKDRH